MADGFGYGGEGDWKTAALVRAMKVMASGFSMAITSHHLEDFTEMANIECLHIDEETTIRDFKGQCRNNEMFYSISGR